MASKSKQKARAGGGEDRSKSPSFRDTKKQETKMGPSVRDEEEMKEMSTTDMSRQMARNPRRADTAQADTNKQSMTADEQALNDDAAARRAAPATAPSRGPEKDEEPLDRDAIHEDIQKRAHPLEQTEEEKRENKAPHGQQVKPYVVGPTVTSLVFNGVEYAPGMRVSLSDADAQRVRDAGIQILEGG